MEHDACKPAEIAHMIENAGVAKAKTALGQMFTLAMLAGGFIGFGVAAHRMVMTGADAMGVVDRKIGAGALFRNRSGVCVGNPVGAVGLAVAFSLTGLLQASSGETAAKVALAKVAHVAKGALCNALVCLAVWLTFSPRDTTGNILAILWPITTFVLLGLEHSIANMLLIPLGYMSGADIALGPAVAALFWVTLGNIIGGAGGVALAYRYAYLGGRT